MSTYTAIQRYKNYFDHCLHDPDLIFWRAVYLAMIIHIKSVEVELKSEKDFDMEIIYQSEKIRSNDIDYYDDY